MGPTCRLQVEWLARSLPRAMLPQALFPSRVQAQFATAWSLTRFSAEHTPATYNHISLEISFFHARIRLAANLHMRAHGFYMKTSYCHDGFPSAELCLQHQVCSRPMDKLCAQSFCMHMSSIVKFQLFSSSIPVNWHATLFGLIRKSRLAPANPQATSLQAAAIPSHPLQKTTPSHVAVFAHGFACTPAQGQVTPTTQTPVGSRESLC